MRRTIVYFFLSIIGLAALTAQNIIPLKLYRNSEVSDNFTNSTLNDEEEAKKNGYYYIRLEGYVFSPEYGETLDQKLVKPLNVYWSESKNDFFTTAVTLTDNDARKSGYEFVEVMGFVYKNQEKNTRPLKLFWNSKKNDYFTTSTAESEKEAAAENYQLIEVSGYVLTNNTVPSVQASKQQSGTNNPSDKAAGTVKTKKKKTFLDFLDDVNKGADKIIAKIDSFEKSVDKILGTESNSGSGNNTVNKPDDKKTNNPGKPVNNGQTTKTTTTTPTSKPPASTDLKAIPEVKFTATDPCAPNNQVQAGLPWEQTKAGNIKLPAGVVTVIPESLPDINSLSKFSYNAAVSVAFEGMRLIYGPMPDKEAKKFEQTWAPLFDYPTSEIISYLNKLNPLINQFLAVRESYMRSLSAIQLVMLDAATAVDFDDRLAFESAISESNMHTAALLSLDASMKELANRIQSLGNPPNPNDAKCEANRRYRKHLTGEVTKQVAFDGTCWAGYSYGQSAPSGSSGSPFDVISKSSTSYFYYILALVQNGQEAFCMLTGNHDGSANASMQTYNQVQNLLKNKDDMTNYPNGSYQKTYFEKFQYPDIPTFDEYENFYIPVADLSGTHKENLEKAKIKSKLAAHSFYKTALQWTKNGTWQNYTFTPGGKVPADMLTAFNNDVRKISKGETIPQTVTDNKQDNTQQKDGTLASDNAESLRESIELHTEIAESLKERFNKEVAERSELQVSLSKAKTETEKKDILSRLEQYSLRIMGIQSNIQAELDLAKSYQTGEIVHTRTVFDDYAREKMIHDMRIDAARRDATRQIADRIERQIRLLPKVQQENARDLAYRMIDGKTLVSGDVEKARALAVAFGKQIEGYAIHDQAMEDEKIAESELKEAGAQAVIFAAGSICVGIGSGALANAYGAEAAVTIYGTKALGAVYGGVTGYLSGGPKAGLMQAANFWSPVTGGVASFVNGYMEAGNIKGATTSTKIWEGAKSAGTDYIIGKVFETGVGVVAKGSSLVMGKQSRLFKPLLKSPSQRSLEVMDMIRTSRSKLEATDIVNSFRNLDEQLRTLQMDEVANAVKIQSLKKEMNQLAASMNADYHAKWLFKYKADPKVRNSFDKLVQENYAAMTPKMTETLKNKGYDMSDITYKQFRNASSGGTSSMDLDLAPVSKQTGLEPAYFLKNGRKVSAKEFMLDAQQAMNSDYYQTFKISAKHSDMNLTTSAHPEAFSTTELLKENIDFSKLTSDDIKSIGEVLNVKTSSIGKNDRLTKTTQLQSKCREANKELENMLLKKLNQDLAKTKPGSNEYQQLKADISYWQDISAKLKKIGSGTNDPFEIIKTNREIQQATGGKDANQVVNDLIEKFGYKIEKK